MKAILALEDGSVFYGTGFGARTSASGEVCFNTSMTGYQEILTDPSYKGQIVTMTYPLIGNYGVNTLDVESWRPHAAGFVIRELSPVVSNWRADSSLEKYIEQNGIPGIQGIDTRALTKKLRVRGALVSKAATLLASIVKSFASHPARVAAQITERKNRFRFIRILYQDSVGLFSPNFSSRDNGRHHFARIRVNNDRSITATRENTVRSFVVRDPRRPLTRR